MHQLVFIAAIIIFTAARAATNSFISVDGKDHDWKSHFKMKSLTAKHPIKEASIHLDTDSLCLLFRGRIPQSFQIEIDHIGSQDFDLRLRSDEIAKESKASTSSLFETCLDAKVLDQRKIRYEPKNRNWLRLRPIDRDGKALGPAVAALWPQAKGERPYTYPFQRPEFNSSKALRIDWPLKGRAYVVQGAYGAWTHKNSWGYDIHQASESIEFTHHSIEAKENKTTLESYLSWGEVVTSPADGELIRIERSAPDLPPLQFTKDAPMNQVLIKVSELHALWLVHFQQNSLPDFNRGQRINRAQPLGKIGNSGPSGWPHLHLGAWDSKNLQKVLPLQFRNVRVYLNPQSDDPYQFSADEVHPEEGLFIEAR